MKNERKAFCLNSQHLILGSGNPGNTGFQRKVIANRARITAEDLRIKTADALTSLKRAAFFINDQTISESF
jgi:hypothetical protein